MWRTEKSSPPGRPKDLEKRTAIVLAARALFFEKGLGAVTMEAVAAASGVSKMTVYGNFADKERLFEEVIWQEAAKVGKSLSNLQASGTDIRTQLIAFGYDFVKFQLRTDVRAFNRMLAAEGSRYPKLANAFVESGPKAIFKLLIARLRESADRGDIQIGNYALAAGHIVALLKGIENASIELGLSPIPTSRQIRAHVQECVDFFLSAVSSTESSQT